MGWFTVSVQDDKVCVDITDDNGKHSHLETDAMSARSVAADLIEGADHVEQTSRENGGR